MQDPLHGKENVEWGADAATNLEARPEPEEASVLKNDLRSFHLTRQQRRQIARSAAVMAIAEQIQSPLPRRLRRLLTRKFAKSAL